MWCRPNTLQRSSQNVFTTLECQSWGELCVPVFQGLWVFIVAQNRISLTCATSLFPIGKIFINVRIFQNPPYARILLILGFYELGLIMRRRFFPFGISWRPHNDHFSATWPFGLSTPVRSYQCGADQIPSKGQVRMFSQLQSVRAGVNYAYLFLKVFGVFIVAQNQLPLFAQQGVSLWRRSSLMGIYYGILLILGLFPHWDSID